ncbi:quinolinate synthase NadA [Cecembia rubra]|uniref:quinolinate synthase NadA n=1 Tax=Cecembia rubra TaxID=1485585 RepID=UPI0027150BCC|nr:quinolinate synthase NadA [Cecembia rubra]
MLPGSSENTLHNMITAIKKEKNAVILAHYYQSPEIQEVADFVGDSLELSRKAMETDSSIIVFAGVHFMGETAKIINPKKKVLIPDLGAGCSLSDSCTPEAFKREKALNPDHVFVTYINCSAEVKAMSDIICTSSNAEKIIDSIPKTKKIYFSPDKNLGKYLVAKTGRDIKLWNGSCVVHEAFSLEKVMDLMVLYPNAKILVHPEADSPLLKIADYIGSTSGMIRFVQEDESNEFLIGTESGIIHQMAKKAPEKVLIPIPIAEDNTCACSECAFMKVNTLQKLYNCLLYENPEIVLDPNIQQEALHPLMRMLELSK